MTLKGTSLGYFSGTPQPSCFSIQTQELTAEAESKPLDEARNTVMATAPYRK
jgi:hypothetical protein